MKQHHWQPQGIASMSQQIARELGWKPYQAGRVQNAVLHVFSVAAGSLCLLAHWALLVGHGAAYSASHPLAEVKEAPCLTTCYVAPADRWLGLPTQQTQGIHSAVGRRFAPRLWYSATTSSHFGCLLKTMPGTLSHNHYHFPQTLRN